MIIPFPARLGMNAEMSEQEFQLICSALDKLTSAVKYLREACDMDAPRDRMAAGLEARAILINLANQILDAADGRLGVQA